MLVMCFLFFFFFLTLSYSFSILLPNIPHVVFVSLSVDNLLTEALAYVILIWLSSHNLLSVYSFPNPSFYPAHPFSFFFFFLLTLHFAGPAAGDGIRSQSQRDQHCIWGLWRNSRGHYPHQFNQRQCCFTLCSHYSFVMFFSGSVLSLTTHKIMLQLMYYYLLTVL